jgi:tRNA threonylcarbamoyladenosine biosynthesis protein TsaB
MLAFSTEKPVAGIPTLEALAYGARNVSPLVCAVISAGIRNTVYAACYRVKKDGVTREGDYFAGAVRDLVPLIKEPVVLVGSGAEQYRGLLINEDSSLKMKVRALEASPSGGAVACLAAGRLERGSSDDVLSLTPLYLKESTARAFVNKYSGGVKAKE